MMMKHLYQKLSEKRLKATLSTDENSHIVSIFDDRELLDVVFENGQDVELFYLDKRDYVRQRCSGSPAASKRKNILGFLHGLLVVLCFGFSAGLFIELCKPEDPRMFDDSLNSMGSSRVLFYKKEGQIYSDLDRAGGPQEVFEARFAKTGSFFEGASASR